MLLSSTVFSMDEDITGTISCPPIPRLSNFGTIIGIWAFLFFGAVVPLRVTLPTLIAQWWRGMHHGYMSYSNWLKGLISDKTFQLSRTFRGKYF